MPDASRLLFLDTETTGLAGGTGTCAFLIGIGNVEGMKFVVRQFFLRDYPEEKAMLEALAEALEPCQGIVTFNGKTFDVPLLETRYALARMKSPLDRLIHFDALHPARRLWKLRLESCKLTDLEEAILGISREGDVPGAEIPAIYFDYLRRGDARGLQPVFYHNALDVLTLAAITVELARALGDGGAEALGSPLDLFSLSRILGTAGSQEKSISTCRQALAAGLPQQVESLALKHLAAEFKRKRQHESAVELWLELSRREPPLAVEALEELAIHYEHHLRDLRQALEFTLAALARLEEQFPSVAHRKRFARRMERLQRKLARAASTTLLR
jgi:tetratricopeptide (TPR) repeat protein